MEAKISQLPTASSSTPIDYLMVVQGGVNKRIQIATLLKTLNSNDNIMLNPNMNAINTKISSRNLENLLYVSGSGDSIGVNTSTPDSLLHVNGNLKVGKESTDAALSGQDGLIVQSSETATFYYSEIGINGLYKNLNAARETSVLVAENGVITARFALNNGSVGQTKTIICRSLQVGSASIIIRVTSGLGFNQATFTAAGDSLTLKCIDIAGSPKWVIVGSRNAVIATTA